MHAEAFAYVSDAAARAGVKRPGLSVLDIGGRDVNGTTREVFQSATEYVIVDISAHPSVDVVCDAADLDLGRRFDVVVSTECLEHAERAPEIVAAAFQHLHPGGVFIATMAGPGRAPHGEHGAAHPKPGEFYRNVEPDQLERWLIAAGFEEFEIDRHGTDLRCMAWKGA